MKKKGLLRALATFSSLTMVSRVVGLIRDVIIGAVFGPGAATDAFFVAFRIPNFMRRLFAEGAFATAFVPVLTEYKEKRSPEEVRRLIGGVAGCLGMVLLIVTALGIAFAPQVLMVFAPGFAEDPAKFQLTVSMLRWTFSYILFISLTACAGGVLNSYGRFGPPAFAPVLLNLCLIAAALWLSDRFAAPIEALAVAVFVAGIAQFLMQLPYLARLKLLAWPRLAWRDPGVRRILRLMGPSIFGSSVAQVNLLVGTILASFLVSGSVTWLYYADRLMEFPLGIFAVALGTVILPRLSAEHANASLARFSGTLDWGLRWVLLIAVPFSVGMIVLAVPLLATLFQHGRFQPSDTLAAAMALSAYGVGMAGFILVKVAAPGYFARQDTRTPVKFAVASVGVNIALSTIGVYFLHDSGFGHVALALAASVAQLLNAALLLGGLRRLGVYQPGEGWSAMLRQVLLASLIMGALLYWPARQSDFWLYAAAGQRALALTGLMGVAGVAYFGSLWLMGLRWRALREPAAP